MKRLFVLCAVIGLIGCLDYSQRPEWSPPEGAQPRSQLSVAEPANATGACFRGANLKNADFSYVNLENTDLRDTNLEGTNFRGANLWGAKITEAQKEAVLKALGLDIIG